MEGLRRHDAEHVRHEQRDADAGHEHQHVEQREAPSQELILVVALGDLEALGPPYHLHGGEADHHHQEAELVRQAVQTHHGLVAGRLQEVPVGERGDERRHLHAHERDAVTEEVARPSRRRSASHVLPQPHHQGEAHHAAGDERAQEDPHDAETHHHDEKDVEPHGQEELDHVGADEQHRAVLDPGIGHGNDHQRSRGQVERRHPDHGDLGVTPEQEIRHDARRREHRGAHDEVENPDQHEAGGYHLPLLALFLGLVVEPEHTQGEVPAPDDGDEVQRHLHERHDAVVGGRQVARVDGKHHERHGAGHHHAHRVDEGVLPYSTKHPVRGRPLLGRRGRVVFGQAWAPAPRYSRS